MRRKQHSLYCADIKWWSKLAATRYEKAL